MSNRQGSPSLDLGAGLQLHPRRDKHSKERAAGPLPFGQWRGRVQSCGPPPTQLAADGAPTTGLPQWSATTVQPQAALRWVSFLTQARTRP